LQSFKEFPALGQPPQVQLPMTCGYVTALTTPKPAERPVVAPPESTMVNLRTRVRGQLPTVTEMPAIFEMPADQDYVPGAYNWGDLIDEPAPAPESEWWN
jgi:hypothetical protein